MAHDIAPAHGPGDFRAIANVAIHEGRPSIALLSAIEVDHRMTAVEQRGDDVIADFPAAAGDYYILGICHFQQNTATGYDRQTMFNLNGKIAVVTGAGSGIGEAIARCFATAGATVIIAERDEPSGQRVAGSIGASASFVRVDVADEASVNSAAAAILDRYGRCDVLVNNAGVGSVGTLLTTTAAEVDRLFGVNARGAFNMCKAIVPGMIERKSGSVINMASVAGVIAIRDRLAYTVSKFAVVGLTKALALDHSSSGVRFNCICPGRVETPWVAARIKEYPDPEKAYREMAATQLTRKMLRPEEIASAALYLAVDESASVTASALMIDAGWTAGK
jgi:NAD(P)-dependent dehydrogenase (short-subunit alcohol dehydrogenase family)